MKPTNTSADLVFDDVSVILKDADEEATVTVCNPSVSDISETNACDDHPSTPNIFSSGSSREPQQKEDETLVKTSLESQQREGDALVNDHIRPKPYTFKNEMKGLLKLERTGKFAAFGIPASYPIDVPHSPNGRGSSAVNARLSRQVSREPSRKLDYLRNSLRKLSMMDVYAVVPEPSPASAKSPVRTSMAHSHLLRMDSGGELKACDVCGARSLKGLSCASGHYTCTDCFAARVQDMCCQPAVLRNNDFSIFCPVPRCSAAPWTSYHVRKLLDGPTLQMYIDALVESCKAGSSTSAMATSPMPLLALGGASRPSSTRNSVRKSTRMRTFTEGAVESPASAVLSPISPAVVSGPDAASGRSGDTESEEWKFMLETTEMLREQLRKLNVVPMEYIPLPDIQAELATIFEKINSEQPYDEQRMDFLLMCMENNPVYMAEKAEMARLWREEMSTYTQECLQTMRGFVPGHIFEASLQSLKEVDGLNVELAKRLLSKKCLWLVRMCVVDIERVHEVDLMGRFNPIAQNLDIVELAAIFASVPEKFLNDPTGRKAQWRLNLENALREMDKQRKTGALVGAKARNPCYKKQTVVPFSNRNTMKRVDFVQSSLT